MYAKLVIKSPKTFNKATESMNYDVYKYIHSKDLSTTRSIKRSSGANTSSRKAMFYSPNNSYFQHDRSRFEVGSTNVTNSPPPVRRSTKLSLHPEKLESLAKMLTFKI